MSRGVDYALLGAQMEGFLETEAWFLPALSNASALLMETLPEINWAGFYVMREGQLVLGPFQGKTACIHIPAGKGVCGTAVREKRTQRVADVHAFPRHIACDSASASEIVIPVYGMDGEIRGVLDIDSPVTDRFDEDDQAGLEAFVRVLAEKLCWE